MAQAAGLLDAVDWTNSPLGSMDQWPAPLAFAARLMAHSESAMFLVWGEQRIFLYNQAYLPVLGSKHPHALGRPMVESWSEVWEEVSGLLQQSFDGASLRYENHPFTIHRNGNLEQAWFDFSYTPVFTADLGVGGVLCILTEKTGQVLAERALKQQADMLRQLFEDTPGFMALLRGPQHVFELANASYRELIGGRDPVGKSLRSALPEIVGQGFPELLDDVYRSGERFLGRRVPVTLQRGEQQGLEQRWVDFVYQPVFDREGAVNGIFVQGTDVTHHVQTETALRDSEARFRVIANAIPHLVWSALPDGAFDFFNDKWRDYTGLDDMQGKHDWLAIVHPGDRPQAAARWAAAMASGQPYEVEYRLFHQPSGAYRWCLGRALPVCDGDGAIIRWLGSCTDIHEQRTLTEELRQAAERKDEFLAMLAHELRNPLAPVRAAAELLKLGGAGQPRHDKAVAVIDRQVRHMTELVDDLLDVSRVTRGLVVLDLQPADLNAVVAAALEQARPLIEGRGHALHVQVEARRAVVLGDTTRLIQVVVNLLSNAAKYTPRGGRIDVSVAARDGQVCIAVHDNGSGIEADLLPQVFDIFKQAKRTPDRSEGGLGIGLTLVKSLVCAHGGSVLAHSDGPGRGSRFEVLLPAYAGQGAAADAAPPASAAGAGHGQRILIVDDNTDAAETLGQLLEALGHDVRICFDGGNALELAPVFQPDILILDVGLPDMNGYQLAARLRAMAPLGQALYIALTGYGQEHDRAQSRTAGFQHHLVKPVDLALLTQVLASQAPT